MIPRQSKQISFCDEFTQILEKALTPGRLMLAINVNNILVFITLLLFTIYDINADIILWSNRNENMTMLYGKYGYNDNDTASLAPVSYLFCYSFCFLMVLNFYIFLEFRECWVGWGVVCGFMFNM
ncbi:hypothetical protein C2G38_94251 [Gigaspora rosea]|uniref:Uncharacterized protein n=1 Tax=Gigaspora rosea TaxID=44941 RepID=A0A397UQ00_9GLOM|nr:hypothetical protein C2G38_94251 [Gigaspora rosea]